MRRSVRFVPILRAQDRILKLFEILFLVSFLYDRCPLFEAYVFSRILSVNNAIPLRRGFFIGKDRTQL